MVVLGAVTHVCFRPWFRPDSPFLHPHHRPAQRWLVLLDAPRKRAKVDVPTAYSSQLALVALLCL
jgi:hypothetical protein